MQAGSEEDSYEDMKAVSSDAICKAATTVLRSGNTCIPWVRHMKTSELRCYLQDKPFPTSELVLSFLVIRIVLEHTACLVLSVVSFFGGRDAT